MRPAIGKLHRYPTKIVQQARTGDGMPVAIETLLISYDTVSVDQP